MNKMEVTFPLECETVNDKSDRVFLPNDMFKEHRHTHSLKGIDSHPHSPLCVVVLSMTFFFRYG